MAIFQQQRAVLVFRGDTEPLVLIRHQAGPVRGKSCIGVVGIFVVFGDIGRLRVLKAAPSMTLWSPLKTVEAISVCTREALLVVESGASYESLL